MLRIFLDSSISTFAFLARSLHWHWVYDSLPLDLLPLCHCVSMQTHQSFFSGNWSCFYFRSPSSSVPIINFRNGSISFTGTSINSSTGLVLNFSLLTLGSRYPSIELDTIMTILTSTVGGTWRGSDTCGPHQRKLTETCIGCLLPVQFRLVWGISSAYDISKWQLLDSSAIVYRSPRWTDYFSSQLENLTLQSRCKVGPRRWVAVLSPPKIGAILGKFIERLKIHYELWLLDSHLLQVVWVENVHRPSVINQYLTHGIVTYYCLDDKRITLRKVDPISVCF